MLALLHPAQYMMLPYRVVRRSAGQVQHSVAPIR